VGADYTFLLMALSGAVFGICFFIYAVINRSIARRAAESKEQAEGSAEPSVEDEPLSKEGSFQLVFRTRYLLLIALLILVSNFVNTTGEFILSNAARRLAEEKKPIALVLGADVAKRKLEDKRFKLSDAQKKKLKKARTPIVNRFYGDFFFFVNLEGLLIQMLVVSRIFKYFGVRAALFVLPVIAFGGYAAIGLIGGVMVLRIAKSAENSMDYSLQNTVKQALFLPTSREAKYKAKAAIDTFFVRFGDAASAAIIFVGLNVLFFTAKTFALVNVAVIGLLWIPLAVGIAREHKRISPEE
jgi:AAA family ATP:ADP antiporter